MWSVFLTYFFNLLHLSLHKGGYQNRAWVAKKIGILVLRCSDSRNRAVDLVSNGSKVELSIKKDQKSIHRFWTSLCLGDTGAQIVFLENNYSETMVENEFWCLMVYTAVLEYQKLFVWWAMMKTKPNEHHSGPRSRKRVSVVWGLVVSRSNLFCIATWSESGWFGHLICMHYPTNLFRAAKRIYLPEETFTGDVYTILWWQSSQIVTFNIPGCISE